MASMPGTIAATKSLQHPRDEMPVTITAVDTFQLRIPLDIWAPPPLFAGTPRTHVEAVYVRVTTSKGVVGWGECNGFSGAADRRGVRQMDQACRGRPGPDRPAP